MFIIIIRSRTGPYRNHHQMPKHLRAMRCFIFNSVPPRDSKMRVKKKVLKKQDLSAVVVLEDIFSDFSNFHEKCRLCFKEVGDRNSRKQITDEIQNKIYSVLQIHMSLDGMGSEFICSKCENILNVSHQFTFKINEKLKCYEKFSSKKVEHSDDDDELPVPFQENFIKVEDDLNLSTEMELVSPMSEIKEESSEDGSPSESEGGENEETIERQKQDQSNPQFVQSYVGGKVLRNGDTNKRRRCKGNFKTKLQCDICGKKCCIKGDLAKHMITHIGLEYRRKDFHCQICGRSYFSRSGLQTHILNNHERPSHLTCSICGITCWTEKGLENHKLRPCRLPCEICGKIYSKNVLKQHINGVHFNLKQYQCDICGRKCSYTSLAKHITTHIDLEYRRKDFHCQICGSSYFSRNGLKNHILNVHEKPKHLTCSLCGRTFMTEKGLKRHQLHPCRLPCEVCGKFFFKNMLRHHLKNVHFNLKPYQCDICGNKFCKRNLAQHMITHIDFEHRKKEFHCQICESSYFNKGSLQIHILNNHEKPKHLTCSLCGRTFMTEKGLKRHQLHPCRLPCEVCGKFFFKNTLRHHLKNVHFNLKPYQCDICEKKFCKINLAQHMITHIDFEHRKKEFHCQICGTSFFKKQHLQTHMIGVHEKPKHLTCSICGRTFWTEKGLENHKLRPHNIPCKICGKMLRKSALKEHLNVVHFKIKRYQCDICGNKFVKNYLARHMNTHVSSEHIRKNFHCQICGSSFFEKCRLKSHMIKVHEKPKHLTCSICGRTWSTEEGLKNHKLRPHYLSCELCGKMCDICGKKFSRQNIVRHMNTHIPSEHRRKDRKFKTKLSPTRHIFSHEKSTNCKYSVRRKKSTTRLFLMKHYDSDSDFNAEMQLFTIVAQ
ncbi:CLUMA_CG009461, isoform A [Clunio marinus]|uniref:CLUMA_CG009461, isoform A n=1 Tax=Clunio marinus TaxID=568069 RepID=A0A1J1I6V7_9DIPT|nr:CLUMA_CG009461, isoform A [Clunio marinus]